MLFQALGARVGVGASTVLPASPVVGMGIAAVAVAVAGIDMVGASVLVAITGTLRELPHCGVSQAVSKTRIVNNKKVFCVLMDNSAV